MIVSQVRIVDRLRMINLTGKGQKGDSVGTTITDTKNVTPKLKSLGVALQGAIQLFQFSAMTLMSESDPVLKMLIGEAGGSPLAKGFSPESGIVTSLVAMKETLEMAMVSLGIDANKFRGIDSITDDGDDLTVQDPEQAKKVEKKIKEMVAESAPLTSIYSIESPHNHGWFTACEKWCFTGNEQRGFPDEPLKSRKEAVVEAKKKNNFRKEPGRTWVARRGYWKPRLEWSEIAGVLHDAASRELQRPSLGSFQIEDDAKRAEAEELFSEAAWAILQRLGLVQEMTSFHDIEEIQEETCLGSIDLGNHLASQF